MSELISVIVPIYKAEKYLDRCVESIVNQTYKNLEIILVDDGSPDNCPAICDKWAKKDDRIKVIHKQNGGELSARTAGITEATGTFIGFIDSDDWVDNDMYEYLYNLAVNNDAQVVCLGMRTIDVNDVDSPNETQEKEYLKFYDFNDIIKYLNADSLWSMCNKMYHSSLFDGMPKLPGNLSFSSDFMYNYFLYKKVNRLIVSNQIKYNYFRHCESAIAGEIKYNLIDDSMQAYKIVDDDFDKNHPAYKFQVINKVKNDFFLINSVIRNHKCLDRYDVLRKDILKYKKYILSKDCRDVVERRHRIGTVLLMFAPKLYNQTILVRRKIRGY
ncbi:MAG: glycosyltransferase [Acetobacter sp.]|nr:glycosyltransferase [Bacteroides sp.]MCM1341563.1 glycosyltransferase [Acetobacter sp.]MCM1433640.1 glycosyltransferase [Clostridiales bacterium]